MTKLAGCASIVGLALILTACASSDLTVSYSGPFTLQVSTCALLATSASLRDDDGTPNSIWVDGVSIQQDATGPGSDYLIEGMTNVSIGADQPQYSWSCELTLTDRGSLSAELTEFVKVDPQGP